MRIFLNNSSSLHTIVRYNWSALKFATVFYIGCIQILKIIHFKCVTAVYGQEILKASVRSCELERDWLNCPSMKVRRPQILSEKITIFSALL